MGSRWGRRGTEGGMRGRRAPPFLSVGSKRTRWEGKRDHEPRYPKTTHPTRGRAGECDVGWGVSSRVSKRSFVRKPYNACVEGAGGTCVRPKRWTGPDEGRSVRTATKRDPEGGCRRCACSSEPNGWKRTRCEKQPHVEPIGRKGRVHRPGRARKKGREGELPG
eukprot:scaffold412_cov311-Pavlova_lutheri.AAC.22